MLKSDVDFLPSNPKDAVEWARWFARQAWGDDGDVVIHSVGHDLFRIENQDCVVEVGIRDGQLSVKVERKYRLDDLHLFVSDLLSVLSTTPSA